MKRFCSKKLKKKVAPAYIADPFPSVPRCKKPVEATKQMSVWRLPHVLIIQLKRFSFKYVLCSDKIDKFVQYPVR